MITIRAARRRHAVLDAAPGAQHADAEGDPASDLAGAPRGEARIAAVWLPVGVHREAAVKATVDSVVGATHALGWVGSVALR